MMRSKRTWLWVAVLLAAAACAALAVRIVASIDYRNNDFFTFWLAGHLVTQGGNPYDPAQWVAGHQAFGVTWIPNQTYVYPLPLSLLFAPLGWLSLKSAFTVWVALSELMILVALALLAFGQPGSGSGRYFLPLLIGLIFFRPTSLTLFHGQLSGALLLLLAGTIFLWEKGKWEWGSLLLPLLMLKPNIGAPLLALLGAWLLVRKRFRALLAIAAGLLALLVIGLIQNPHWVTDYWAIGNLKVAQNFGGAPTIWGLSALPCRNGSGCMFALGGPAVLLLGLGFLWFAFRRRNLAPLEIMALAVGVTMLVTPYTWTYDQVLLLVPILAIVLELDRRKGHFLLVSGFFLGIDLVVLVLLVFDTLMQVEILNVVIPLLVLGILGWLLAPASPPGRSA